MLACTPLVGCVVGVDSQGQIVREEKRFSVDGAPDLRLTTFDGAIEVRGTDGSQVLVEIEKRGPTREAVDELRVEATQDGRRIDVEVKRPAREGMVFGINVSTSAKLIVSVPRHATVLARTGDGAIRIEGVEGRLELRTGDGSIHVSDVKGELVLNTGDGSINVDHAEGRLTLETGDGGVNVEGNLSVVTDAHRRRVDCVSRGSGDPHGRRLGHLDRRRLGLDLPPRRIQCRSRRAHRRWPNPQRAGHCQAAISNATATPTSATGARCAAGSARAASASACRPATAGSR